MEQIVECLIAGGPQHGVVRRQLWDPRYTAPPVIASADGAVCIAAACRHDRHDSNRFLLLHPRATGAQILAMMDRLDAQRCAQACGMDGDDALTDSG
ncbi:hypothetical protein [Dyella acidiphila]|uniref:Uncharacterized protein n=1 Tax=Dyella acidiphila TaxID=2775866 RepID=A0ABR9G9V2_9GAMM|nr:hypothetical protein [Dyella acidiphila]MBE1160794.1 hypothetical protein [Dyella acidiphila]